LPPKQPEWALTLMKPQASLKVGNPGIIHGSRTYLMQTPDGQIIEARNSIFGQGLGLSGAFGPHSGPG